MSFEEAAKYRKSRMMSLVEVSTNKCIQNFSKLQDVGRTPFHLIKPILRRMSAKQLSQIEEQSPQIMPESDSLWPELIAKEFPGRPERVTNAQSQVKGRRRTMPNKGLYYKYMDERESFRKDSAERLRNMTEKLKMQKSANSIVAVPQLLKDPTVKKRREIWGSVLRGNGRVSTNKNSILNKARKDLQSRSLMFPKYSQNVKKYDPFDAFKVLKQEQDSRPILPPREHRRAPASATHPSAGRNNRINRDGSAPATPSIKTRSSTAKSTSVGEKVQSPTKNEVNRTTLASPSKPAQPKRTKPEPSIFLTNKRARPSKPNSGPRKAKDCQDDSIQPTKKVKSVKSSIFN